jgi:hypothetical protein
MGICKNIIDRSDISTYPISLKYPVQSATFIALDGVNRYTIFTASLDPESLLYRSVKQLYYNEYLTGSLLNSSSAWNDTWQSTAARGTLDADYRYFPTAQNAQVSVIQIDRSQYGENIARGSLRLTVGGSQVVDDGNGNLVLAGSPTSRMGNVFYSQGILVITDPAVQPVLPSPSPAPSPAASPAASPIPVPSVTPTPTRSATVVPSLTPTPTVSSTPAASPGASPSATPSVTPTITVTPTRTVTPTPTPTRTITPTPTISITPSPSTPTTVNTFIYARVDPSASPSTNLLVFEASYDGGVTWSEIGAQFDDTACSQRASVNVIQNSSLIVRVKDTITTGVFSTNLSLGIATCPSYNVGSDQCQWTIPTDINRSVSFNINIDNQLVC